MLNYVLSFLLMRKDVDCLVHRMNCSGDAKQNSTVRKEFLKREFLSLDLQQCDNKRCCVNLQPRFDSVDNCLELNRATIEAAERIFLRETKV